MRFLLFVFAALFLLAFISSCEKEVEFNEDETNTFTSDGDTENTFSVVESIINEGMQYVEDNGIERTAATSPEFECATITLSGTKASGNIKIDFGNGCTAAGGKVWKGIVILEYSGRRYEAGSIVQTIFQDFHIDDIKIEGNVKSTTVSSSLQGAIFDVVVTNGKLTWPDQTFATWNADRTHNWSFTSEGLMLSVEGTANGITRFGKDYTTEITQALIYKSECISKSAYMAIQGRKSILVGELEILVDYGNGACDRTATISVGRETKDVNF